MNSKPDSWQKNLAKESPFIVLCLMLVILFAGAAYILLQGSQLIYWDEKRYFALAMNLHHGMYSADGISPTAFDPPGYPWILYLFMYVSTSTLFLKFTNFIFFAICIWLSYLLLYRHVSPTAGLLGAILTAIYPLFFYASGTLYPQIAASAVLLFVIFLVSKDTKRTDLRDCFSGVLFGFLVLISPSFLLYLPVVLAYPFVFKRASKVKTLFLFLGFCFLLVSCWTVRNYAVFDRFVLVSTNGGVNFLLGNSENTGANLGVNTNIEKYIAAAAHLNEFDRDAYFRKEAFKWISAHPLDAAKLYFLKAANYFNFMNELAEKKEQSSFYDMLSFITYYPLLLLALLRICFIPKYPLSPLERFVLILLIASPFLQAIFFTRLRFRIPFDFLTILLSASFLDRFLLFKSRTS